MRNSWLLPGSSLSTDDAEITRRTREPLVAGASDDTIKLSEGVDIVDRWQVENRLFNVPGDKYSDDGGNTWSALPTFSLLDGSATDGNGHLPENCSLAGIAGDYIFAWETSPITLYRSPYTDVFPDGSFDWTKVLTSSNSWSQPRSSGGRFWNFGVNRTDGTVVIGEYSTNDSTSNEPKLYRASGPTGTFSSAHTITHGTI